MSENGAHPQIDLEAMTRQWQDLMMDGWSQVTKQMVHSDTFAAASSAYLDWALSWQKQMRNNTGQFMDAMEFPKRSDIARLSKQLMAVEMRMVDMDERLDKMTRLMGAMSEGLQRVVEHGVRSQQAAAPTEPRVAETKVAEPKVAEKAKPEARPTAPRKPAAGKKKAP